MANVRDNLLYRLRKKGVRVQTRERTIYLAHDGVPLHNRTDTAIVQRVSLSCTI